MRVKQELFGSIYIEIENEFEYRTLESLFRHQKELMGLLTGGEMIGNKEDREHLKFKTKEILDKIEDGLSKIQSMEEK